MREDLTWTTEVLHYCGSVKSQPELGPGEGEFLLLYSFCRETHISLNKHLPAYVQPCLVEIYGA